MPAARNQEVAVRRPWAKRMPLSSRGRRAAVRRSSQAANAAKTRDKEGGKCENGMAGSSGAGWGVATVIVRRGPALGHPDRGPYRLTRVHRLLLPPKCLVRKSRKVQPRGSRPDPRTCRAEAGAPAVPPAEGG